VRTGTYWGIVIPNYVPGVGSHVGAPLGCHNGRVGDLPKIEKEADSKIDTDDSVIVCADKPMRCLRPGCRDYANPICTAHYCSEHHVEICHKLESEVKSHLECDIR